MEPIIECQTINFCTVEKALIFVLPFIVGFIGFLIGFLLRLYLEIGTWVISFYFNFRKLSFIIRFKNIDN